MKNSPPIPFSILLFDGFTLLDAFGPAEALGNAPPYQLGFYSAEGGEIRSAQGLEVRTHPMGERPAGDVLLLPGGPGTRSLVENPSFLARLRIWAEECQALLSVCTGAALLARGGLLAGRAATSNKEAWAWVTSQDSRVDWQYRARWVADDGKREGCALPDKEIYSSAGVSAGIDMALGFLADRHGRALARRIARHMEYVWREDPGADPFAEDDLGF